MFPGASVGLKIVSQTLCIDQSTGTFILSADIVFSTKAPQRRTLWRSRCLLPLPKQFITMIANPGDGLIGAGHALRNFDVLWIREGWIE